MKTEAQQSRSTASHQNFDNKTFRIIHPFHPYKDIEFEIDQVAEHYHSKKSLEESMMSFGVTRTEVRGSIEKLIAYGRVVMADLPKGVGRGNWKTYLTTSKLAEFEKTPGELVENLEEITE